jgi:recombination protein RecR
MSDVERLIQLLAKLPGLGPRSARRAALHLIKRKDSLLTPLARALADAAINIRICSVCGNVDTADPCALCRDERRDAATICVIEDVADLWAIERTGAYKGRYHVLGGTLSALDGRGPDELGIARLIARVTEHRITEVILATSATVEGQTTAHYIAERLTPSGAAITRLAHGVPLGGEINYLDDGTLAAALKARRPTS